MLHEFYRNKNVLITGHTGFKGSWLALWLLQLGAKVSGISLDPLGPQDHFVVTGLEQQLDHHLCDIRDAEAVSRLVKDIDPSIIFHLAAQPIVIDSYSDPLYTFQTNTLGTANLLEAARQAPGVQGIVVITTDKCYENKEWSYAYRENDPLGGHDPYSASKAAAEMVAQSYYRSFFKAQGIGLATARAGNVVGGGDWQEHRLIPDLMRAAQNAEKLHIRNPSATRPWQHLLEPLAGYLELGQALSAKPESISGPWNFGPASECSVTVKEVMSLALAKFPDLPVEMASDSSKKAPHEAQLLFLDSSKSKRLLKWGTVLDLPTTVDLTVDWYQKYFSGSAMLQTSLSQIDQYEGLLSHA